MFIYLENSLLECVKKEHIQHDIIRSLELLSLTIRNGNHIISGDIEILTEISRISDLSLACQKTFQRCAARRTQNCAILNKLSTYTLVDFGRDRIEKSTNEEKTIIKIPIEKIIQINLITDTEVVFEDINDSYTYKTIANWYTREIMQTNSALLKFKKIQGGGNRTYEIYKEKQDSNETFCLCITDSDKKYPTDNAGETSKKVAEVENITIPLSHHLNLDFHEIENLLPLSFLNAHANTPESSSIIKSLKQAEDNGYPEAKLYWDYKKGLRNHYSKTDDSFKNYWSTALNLNQEECMEECTSKQCTCFLISPWPLKREIKDSIESLPQISPIECEALSSTWNKIAKVFVSWTIAAIPQHT